MTFWRIISSLINQFFRHQIFQLNQHQSINDIRFWRILVVKLFSICNQLLREWVLLTTSFLKRKNTRHALYQKCIESCRDPLRKKNSVINVFFFRISYDLIVMSTDLSGQKWVSHFVCTIYDFNLVYTHKTKNETFRIIRQILNLISTRFNGKIVFFRSDRERSFDDEFKDLIFELKITYKFSTFDTAIQNGHAEKKSHLLIIKSKTMIIGANFSEYLWSWIFQTVDYLMNRTSMKKTWMKNFAWNDFRKKISSRSFEKNRLQSVLTK